MEKYRQLSAALKIEYCNGTLKAHYITNEHAMLQKGNNSKCTEYLLPHAVMKPDVTDILITVRYPIHPVQKHPHPQQKPQDCGPERGGI